MLIIPLDKNSKVPVYIQVTQGLKGMIDGGVIKNGTALPSTRKLSNALGLNRNTVMRAYEELWSQGYIKSRQGSYSYVQKPRIPNLQKMKQKKEGALQGMANKIRVDFRSLSPDQRLMPLQRFKQSLLKALDDMKGKALSYGTQQGDERLRAVIAKAMQRHNANVIDDEILIVNGAQRGIDIILKQLTQNNKLIVAESPSYSSALELFDLNALDVLTVPMGRDGADLKALELSIQAHRPAAFYTMPSFQNPTGISSSYEHRATLMQLCEKYNLPVIEDGFEEEMKYYGKAVMPLKAFDSNGLVYYIGSFSKTLFPGIRLGWVASSISATAKLSKINGTTDISSNPLMQAAINDFIDRGYYELHLKKVHAAFKRKMSAALQTLQGLNKHKWSFIKPQGGITIWFQCNMDFSKDFFYSLLEEEGIAVSDGRHFFKQEPVDINFRISISQFSEEEVRQHLGRFVEILNSI